MEAEARARLVDEHMGLVRAIATQVKKQLATSAVELDDLVSYGTQGLLEAAERFDEGRGVVFATFAYYRVRGAVYDGLRSMGHLPRSEYAKVQAAARAQEVLENLAEREAGAAALGTAPAAPSEEDDLRSIYEAMRNVVTSFVISYDSMVDAGVEFTDEDALEPEEVASLRSSNERVKEILATLPEKERHFIEKHYFEDKTLLDAGKELGLSKSWASRLHARALEMIRDRLNDSS